MLKSWFARHCQSCLSSLLIIVGAIASFSCDRTSAQVIADPSLGTTVESTDGITHDIKGGTEVGGTNLFHSFNRFDVPDEGSVNFLNDPTIVNIFSRVTGGKESVIQGLISAQGNANLFLINPNGIIFRENAELDIGGSFIGTTVSTIQFPGGGEFSMTSPVNPLNPLLKVNPSALLFNQIAASPISIQQASLLVNRGQSLLLVGGDVNLEGGRLGARGGRVELGGLNGEGTVSLNIDNNNFSLSYPVGVQLANISLSNAARVSASGGNDGYIQVQARRVRLTDDSSIAVNTLVSKSGGTLVVNASELVELLGGSRLLTDTASSGTAGELRIETGRLIVQDGAQISASTRSQGQGGKLSVNARDSIQLIGTSPGDDPSGLFVKTTDSGDAGNLEIKTGQLIVQDGATISASTSRESTGGGGSIIVKAEELNVFNDSDITVSSQGTNKAGDLEITARSIKLDNQGKLIAQANSGAGGNIKLNLQDLLLLRRNSKISASAGTNGAGGSGGNITFDGKFIVAIPDENSDISANALTGTGGNIQINSQGIFGIQSRTKLTEKSDITASSESGISGVININTPDNSSIQNSFTQLSPNVIDTKALFANSCISRGTKRQENSFTITGSGALRNSPGDVLISTYTTGDVRNVESTSRPWKKGDPIIEPQGLYRLPDGQLILSRACV
ncbi:filamentous hemagglutinin N-terminal domain-containing protein [Nostoc sphaeroides CHAB 2801]|uniref:two-partner secretion domain-containing protein n=1 Tax=Nostoc sphaeroides TaxID=446679 RepID=UPI000E4F1141|nr:filamentous hemagglutinin N-terminal domain-containing protein [Nostoc sphaeroides]MCC5628548.1 filamentous hemagglutinin N-terminal domain-containing protein [Nostoc sphaeroides CHAB 2801]